MRRMSNAFCVLKVKIRRRYVMKMYLANVCDWVHFSQSLQRELYFWIDWRKFLGLG